MLSRDPSRFLLSAHLVPALLVPTTDHDHSLQVKDTLSIVKLQRKRDRLHEVQQLVERAQNVLSLERDYQSLASRGDFVAAIDLATDALLALGDPEGEEGGSKIDEQEKEESRQACIDIFRDHLTAFLPAHPVATYEEWISDLHPENTRPKREQEGSSGDRLDHRFYLRDSDHLIMWNQTVDAGRRVEAFAAEDDEGEGAQPVLSLRRSTSDGTDHLARLKCLEPMRQRMVDALPQLRHRVDRALWDICGASTTVTGSSIGSRTGSVAVSSMLSDGDIQGRGFVDPNHYGAVVRALMALDDLGISAPDDVKKTAPTTFAQDDDDDLSDHIAVSEAVPTW